MLSQIGLIHLVSFILLSLFTTSELQDFYLCLPFFSNQGHTNKQVSSLVDSHAYITHWFELLYKIPPILYCEHLQHFTKEISSTYFMSLPKSRPRLIKKIISWQYLNNSYTVSGENSEWGVILFLSKVELTSLPGTGPIFFQKYVLLPFS